MHRIDNPQAQSKDSQTTPPRPPNQGGQKKRKRQTRRSKKKKLTQDPTREIKLVYNNINGQTRNMWDEIEMYTKDRMADIVCLTETHWKQGDKGKSLNGFKRYWRRRPAEGKKGGGVAIFVKDNLKAREWERANEEEPRQTEHQWLTVHGKNTELAIGLVYMGLNKYQEGNDELEQAISEDIAQLQEEGKQILLIGDFNAHISERDGGVQGQTDSTVTDRNGFRVLQLMEKHNLAMMNKNKKCEGKWTRMKGQEKSVIDFALGSEDCVQIMTRMKIDDGGEGIADSSDHNWIELDIELDQDRIPPGEFQPPRQVGHHQEHRLEQVQAEAGAAPGTVECGARHAI